MKFHRFLLIVDGVVAAILLYFFLAGLQDGSVSSFNIVLWLAILAAVFVPITLALTLKARGRLKTANLILLLPALPGLFFGLFMLLIIVLQPDFR
jgi:hypothetical protein